MDLNLINFTAATDISKDFFKNIAEEVLKREDVDREVFLNVILLGRGKMRNINKRYAGKNQVTDILSFSEKEIKKSTKKDLQFVIPSSMGKVEFIEPKEGKKSLGEILLCLSRIEKQAKRDKKEFKEELAFVFVHGLLHLLGYDHRNTEDTKKMRKKEKELLKYIL